MTHASDFERLHPGEASVPQNHWSSAVVSPGRSTRLPWLRLELQVGLLMGLLALPGMSCEKGKLSHSGHKPAPPPERGGVRKGGVGAPCSSGASCKSGLCLDLSLADDGCAGKVCTRRCRHDRDCPPVAAEPDCDPVRLGPAGPRGSATGPVRVCLYGGWEKRYCR
jgi:hypothetical protein